MVGLEASLSRKSKFACQTVNHYPFMLISVTGMRQARHDGQIHHHEGLHGQGLRREPTQLVF